MVVFTCGHCGESVNKPKVEKHYLTKCKNRTPNLSCMDCFKDFLGNDYDQHTKCVTEEQRYAAKGFVAKEKKGEQKQNVWVELVQSVLDEQKDAPRNVLRILESVSKHNNTPRKKPKFINFVKNICGHKTLPKDIDGAWDLLSVKLAALSAANQQNRNQKPQNGTSNGIKDESIQEDNGDSDVSKENVIKVETNGVTENGKNENGVNENGVNENELSENGVNENEGNANGVTENGVGPKKSKKQLKAEKKQKKYEAELQSAAEIPAEDEPETPVLTKKEKKKKNRTESTTTEAEQEELDNKKKRKRQDTTRNSESSEPIPEPVIEKPLQPLNGEKIKKKKPKIDAEADKSICLHDQNVANKDQEENKDGKFNWHAVIMSVLEKKGNEIQFKRLQKKVLGEYSEATGQEVDDRIADKFIKKLKSAPNVRVDKNRVVLVQ